MIDSKDINQLVHQVMEKLPAGMKNLPEDVRQNMHAALMAGFSKMDLVTRQEFDVQSKVLARTRQKCTALEARVAALEAAMQPTGVPGAPQDPTA